MSNAELWLINQGLSPEALGALSIELLNKLMESIQQAEDTKSTYYNQLAYLSEKIGYIHEDIAQVTAIDTEGTETIDTVLLELKELILSIKDFEETLNTI